MFKNRQVLWGLSAPLLTFDVGNLKLHDLVFQTDYNEIELKNQL